MVWLAHWITVATLAIGSATAEVDSVLTAEIGRLNNQSLFWGPYKPNLYFGVRPRTPHGLWTGLMWSKVDGYGDVAEAFRYTCEQGGDIHGYGWDEYDARQGGIQTIHDKANNIDITTTFVKVPSGGHGGSWAARIKGTIRDDAPKDTNTLIMYYVSQEGEGQLKAEGEGTDLGYEGEVTLSGQSKTLGGYSLVVTAGTGAHPTSEHDLSASRSGETTLVKSMDVSTEHAWQGNHMAFRYLSAAAGEVRENYNVTENPPPPWQVYRIAHRPGSATSHLIQKNFQGDFEFDVIFSSASAGKALTSNDVTELSRKTSEMFSERFSQVFNIKGPFASSKFSKFGKSMFSNLLGGIGYFHGEQLIDRSYASEYDEEDEGFWREAADARARGMQKLEGPYELYTSIPSRPFFPRGFLWDEGFHLIPIADWDMDLTLEIIKSWYNTMDEDGWIPREQILGEEARSKVPVEFQVQYPHYANPPTLFLVIEGFMERLRKSNGSMPAQKEKLSQDETLYTAHLDNTELGEDYLRKIYPKLMRQYQWFRRTQRGDIGSYDREAFSTREAYRWRGRTETHCLTSGLDDYPRPSPPHPGELHVDLMSWVGLMTKSLINIADALNIPEDVADLERTLTAIKNNLKDLHWSEKDGCFCDATIDEFEEHKLVCHKGYISLFPFMVGLMSPEDPKLGKILELLGDEEELFSPHGIRSLSKRDEFYGTGENYWRSPVWMPLNYMILKQLHNVAIQSGPQRERARKLYTKLRINLVETVYKSWVETGFAWEQYNPETGAGQRTQHFTGWTSLVVKIMAMDDLEGESRHDEL